MGSTCRQQVPLSQTEYLLATSGVGMEQVSIPTFFILPGAKALKIERTSCLSLANVNIVQCPFYACSDSQSESIFSKGWNNIL
jgi:hypothetical protein